MGEFDPRVVWEDMTEEMVKDLYATIIDLEKAKMDFIHEPNKETAREIIESMHDLSITSQEIQISLHQYPALVHVAGPMREDECEEDSTHDYRTQKCDRCGSTLRAFHEGEEFMDSVTGQNSTDPDDISNFWFDEGSRVGKHESEQAEGAWQYAEEYELGKHEKECVGFDHIGMDDPK